MKTPLCCLPFLFQILFQQNHSSLLLLPHFFDLMGDCDISDVLLDGFLLVISFYITQTNKSTYHTQRSIEWHTQIRTYSGSSLRAIIARNRLLFFKIFYIFTQIFKYFALFCPFITFFGFFPLFSEKWHAYHFFLALQCFCCSKFTDCRSQISVDYIQ